MSRIVIGMLDILSRDRTHEFTRSNGPRRARRVVRPSVGVGGGYLRQGPCPRSCS
jgi:hypothetical protein